MHYLRMPTSLSTTDSYSIVLDVTELFRLLGPLVPYNDVARVVDGATVPPMLLVLIFLVRAGPNEGDTSSP